MNWIRQALILDAAYTIAKGTVAAHHKGGI